MVVFKANKNSQSFFEGPCLYSSRLSTTHHRADPASKSFVLVGGPENDQFLTFRCYIYRKLERSQSLMFRRSLCQTGRHSQARTRTVVGTERHQPPWKIIRQRKHANKGLDGICRSRHLKRLPQCVALQSRLPQVNYSTAFDRGVSTTNSPVRQNVLHTITWTPDEIRKVHC